MFPRDPNLPAKESVNCHYIVEPVTDDSVTGLSEKEWDRLAAEARQRLREDRSWEAELDAKHKAASDAYHAEKLKSQGPMPVFADTNKRKTWFEQIDGVTAKGGCIVHISGEHAFIRMEQNNLNGTGVVDALLNPLEIKMHKAGDGSTSRNYIGVSQNDGCIGPGFE